MRLLRWIFGFLVAAAVVAFAVLNRQAVLLTLSPVHPALEVPLYALILLSLFGGFLLGGTTVWLSASDLRRDRRRQRKKIRALEATLQETADLKPGPSRPAAEFFPALPQHKPEMDLS